MECIPMPPSFAILPYFSKTMNLRTIHSHRVRQRECNASRRLKATCFFLFYSVCITQRFSQRLPLLCIITDGYQSAAQMQWPPLYKKNTHTYNTPTLNLNEKNYFKVKIALMKNIRGISAFAKSFHRATHSTFSSPACDCWKLKWKK